MENVMLNPSRQQIKIVDFGLSNVWSASNPLRTHCGSPEYAAPELFVTGKQYGAEVDLWSLGIILYGMVLGQLPFVTSRSGQVTSQERRKKLVAQINRGLSSNHRRALSTFSSEFRSLMSRLLVADATKRITVKELVVHPWVTDRGKKLIRSNPLKNLDSTWRNKIIAEISVLLQTDHSTVSASISQEPLGKYGGMFNILQRRHQMNQLNGDGVTKVLPTLTLLELADLTKNIGKEKKIYTERPNSQRKPQSMMTTRNGDICTPRIIQLDNTLKPVMSSPNEQIMKNKLQQHMKQKKKEQPIPKTRPFTVQNITSQQRNRPVPDYRIIKSPSLRRKAYSATITPKTNRTFSPGGEGVIRNRPSPPGELTNKEEVPRSKEPIKAADAVPRPKKDILELLHMNGVRKTVLVQGNKMAVTQQKREERPKARQTAPDNTRCKSEQCHSRKRPVTGALQQILETSLKNAGVTLSKNNPRAVENPQQGCIRSCHHHKPSISSKHWERSPLAFGDGGSRAITAPHTLGRKPAIYDPIAKSIADYVANNVPERIHNFPWFKK